MKLIDTPNPNAKKILFDHKNEDMSNSLKKVQGVSSVFFGPGFITITKKNNFEWEVITEDIVNIFDKL